MLPEQVKALNAGKEVARDLVQAVKDVKHLRKNVVRFARSDNEDIREQYFGIRLLIARALRSVGQVDRDRSAYLEELEALLREVEAGDIIESGKLDRLLREKRIARDMGTSLINDYGYAQNIVRRLVHGGQVVLGEGLYDLLSAARPPGGGEGGEAAPSAPERRSPSGA